MIMRIGLDSTASMAMNQSRTENIAMPQRQAVEQALRLVLRHLVTPRAT